MKKRFLAILLVICMIALLAPTVLAADADSQTGTASDNSTAWAAEVSGAKYTTLKAAIDAAEDGDTVKLLASYEDWKSIQVSNSITIELNGFDIYRTVGGVALDITDGSVMVTGTGKISGSTNGVLVAYDAALVVGEGVTIEGRDGHGIDNDGKLTVDGATITATKYGIVLYSNSENNWAASLEMVDGSVSGECGIAAYANTTVIVKGGTVTGTVAGLSGEGGSHGTTFTVEDGTIQSEGGVGIYHPQNGTLNISGGTIKGATGINIKSGTMNVTGGDIIGTGEKADYSFVGGGFNITGDALAVESCGYPGGAPTVSITGGNFTSENADAVASYAGNNVTETVADFIAGGNYSDESAEEYLVEGYVLKSYVNGEGETVYSVEPVFTVNITIPEGATIVVMDEEGEEIDAEEDGTYELTNGNYTYTVIKENYVSKTGSFIVNGATQSVVVDLDIVTYTVTYRDGDTVLFTENVAHGKDATLPAIPEKEGYTQTAPTWDKDGKNITADTEINAVYTINEYTITFMDENGVYKTLTYKHGETVEMPDVPTKDGYTVKWETTIDKATDDATIKAVYTENSAGTLGEQQPDSPPTGDSSNLWLWVALLFVSGGCLFGITLNERKRKAVTQK